MNQSRFDEVEKLIKMLLGEMPQFSDWASKASADEVSRRNLLRGLMNLWNSMALNPEFVKLQDKLLQEELSEKGVISVFKLPATSIPKIASWEGDITRLQSDAIVNAANSQMLGCFVPGHNCIDNCIHSAAGLQLREECFEIIKRQGHEEGPGGVKLTHGYNLPCSYVLQTVGPVVNGRPTNQNEKDLASCYLSCLDLATAKHFKSLVFPCISTGSFSFPHLEAAKIAVHTVEEYLNEHKAAPAVIFDVFLDIDFEAYNALLN
jgi:O-acetyl-ADP-ribose deacetylase (regulator of RNase III)